MSQIYDVGCHDLIFLNLCFSSACKMKELFYQDIKGSGELTLATNSNFQHLPNCKWSKKHVLTQSSVNTKSTSACFRFTVFMCMHAFPRVEYWYCGSSVLPTSLWHSFALLFIVFPPIPLCNCLLFWSLLLAELLTQCISAGHPPAKKLCDTSGELLQLSLLRRTVAETKTKWPLSLYAAQLEAISPFSDYILCKRIHHHTLNSVPPSPLLLMTSRG